MDVPFDVVYHPRDVSNDLRSEVSREQIYCFIFCQIHMVVSALFDGVELDFIW